MKNECPYCKEIVDKTTGVGDAAKPAKGDISICYSCSGISQYETVSDEGHLKRYQKNNEKYF